jgi:hypothetical protein
MSTAIQNVEALAQSLAEGLDFRMRMFQGRGDPCKGYVAYPKENTLPCLWQEAFKVPCEHTQYSLRQPGAT